MKNKKNIFVVIGSASENSANEKIADYIAEQLSGFFSFTILRSLKKLPHFDPWLSINNPPKEIIEFRNEIEKAEGIIISTPEYIFSIPAGLKNAIEWCVATTVFSDKQVGLITASASGLKGHEELMLIMKTVMAKFSDSTTLLIQGVKGKINRDGKLTDEKTIIGLSNFIQSFRDAVLENRETVG